MSYEDEMRRDALVIARLTTETGITFEFEGVTVACMILSDTEEALVTEDGNPDKIDLRLKYVPDDLRGAGVLPPASGDIITLEGVNYRVKQVRIMGPSIIEFAKVHTHTEGEGENRTRTKSVTIQEVTFPGFVELRCISVHV